MTVRTVVVHKKAARPVKAWLIMKLQSISLSAAARLAGVALTRWAIERKGVITRSGRLSSVGCGNSNLNHDIRNSSGAAGAVIVQNAVSSADSQKWTLIDAGNGY
ncbi:RICIN domain-containing protein [Streptomyces sp. NPDC093591]|uniref:RICIN domain-containing protein n=1 Tax=Streptomyces sp. NPDC093591 TaxID=3366044 RepID=UPI003822F86D